MQWTFHFIGKLSDLDTAARDAKRNGAIPSEAAEQFDAAMALASEELSAPSYGSTRFKVHCSGQDHSNEDGPARTLRIEIEAQKGSTDAVAMDAAKAEAHKQNARTDDEIAAHRAGFASVDEHEASK